MRVISTRIHGAIDYATGAGMLAAPALLGISDEPAAARTLRAAGLVAMAYSLLTDYEFGLVRIIPMPAHLALDAASGVLVAASPWLFGFAGRGRVTVCLTWSLASRRCWQPSRARRVDLRCGCLLCPTCERRAEVALRRGFILSALAADARCGPVGFLAPAQITPTGGRAPTARAAKVEGRS
jgi:hypothetical protein